MFAELAAAAGTALAGAVGTEAWQWVKWSVKDIFAKGGTPEPAVDRWLEATEGAIEAPAGAEAVEQVERRWTTRWEDLLDANPQLEGQLSEFVERIRSAGSISQGTVNQQATAHDQGQQAVLGHGTQTNTFHAPG
jgi:hypothetical protein